jgi:hypothetical protein
MNRNLEALNLAVSEMVEATASTKHVHRKALANAQAAGVTTSDYLRARAMLTATGERCLTAEPPAATSADQS